MADAGTWLCPTPLHRERLLDMERRLARPRAIMYGSLALAFVIGIPWIGAWTLIPLALSILGYSVLKPRIETSKRPEYVVAATVVNALILIVLPGCSLAGGRVIAERLRAGLEEARPGGLAVTASFGVAAGAGAGAAFEPLFRAADAALYEAKRAGRNRVHPTADLTLVAA